MFPLSDLRFPAPSMALLLVGSVLVLPPPPTHAKPSEARIRNLNALFQGLLLGLSNRHKGLKWHERFLIGAVGGTVQFEARRMMGEAMRDPNWIEDSDSEVIRARLLHSVASSCLQNIAAGRDCFEATHIPLGPAQLSIYWRRKASLRIRPMLVTIGMMLHWKSEFDAEVDWRRTLTTGALFMVTDQDLDSSASFELAGMAEANALVVRRKDLEARHGGTLSGHEVVHTMQSEALRTIDILFWGDALWTNPASRIPLIPVGPLLFETLSGRESRPYEEHVLEKEAHSLDADGWYFFERDPSR